MSMGNPHCITYMDDIKNLEIEKSDLYLKMTVFSLTGSIQSSWKL